MIPLVLGSMPLVALVGMATLATRVRHASPKMVAGAYLVGLIGWGLFPVLWLACLGGVLSSYLADRSLSLLPAIGCLAGHGRLQWRLIGLLPAAGLVGFLALRATQVGLATRRAGLPRATRRHAVCRPAQLGTVWVFPSAVPVAFVAGVVRPRAVISSGMLAHLSEQERRAVCEHEAAHLRLGHPRMVYMCSVIVSAFGWFGPVRRAWEGLRRELEATADAAAAELVGQQALRDALVRVASLRVAGRPVGESAGDASRDLECLAFRLARLARSSPSRIAPSAMVGLATAVALLVLAWSGCLLSGAHISPLDLGACLALLVAPAVRHLFLPAPSRLTLPAVWGVRMVKDAEKKP
jgi:Zn-dependent protease with chaperone function